MKRINKKLLADLLEDFAPPDFHAALIDKTLRIARQRKRARRFSMVLSVAAVIGIYAVTFQKTHQRALFSTQTLPQIETAASYPLPNHPRIVDTKPDSTLVVVQTSESAQPKEINDKELVALLSNEPVALVRFASGRTELISLTQVAVSR